MKLDIPQMDKKIKELNAQEVLSAAINQNMAEPDPEGLASYEIFGRPGTDARSMQCGYINLHGHFIHPQALAALKGLKREIFKDIINGTLDYYVKNGELIPVKPGNNPPPGIKAGTGTEWLYGVWDELNWRPKPNDAPATKDRKTFITTLKKNEIFITKWIVIPAFYRDVDLHSNKRNRWNSYYVKLIQLASMIKSSSAMMGIYKTTDAHVKIQNTLEEMHKEIMQFIGGTKGYIHQHVMGKPTKYSCRLVISSADYSKDEEDDVSVDFSKSAFPMHAAVNIFQPFISHGLNKLFNNALTGKTTMRDPDTGELVELDPNYMEILSAKTLDKRLKLYEESKLHRLEPVKIKTRDGKWICPVWYDYPHKNIMTIDALYTQAEMELRKMEEKPVEESVENAEIKDIDINKRIKEKIKNKEWLPLTWLQILYIVAYDHVSDKVVYITRYPTEDYNNTYPSCINLIPCTETTSITFGGNTYPKFPHTQHTMETVNDNILEHLFVDTISIHPAYLKALGADFDGDMVSIIPIFTNEANTDAKKYIHTITNMGSIDGGTMRGLSDIAAQTIYSITMRVPNGNK